MHGSAVVAMPIAHIGGTGWGLIGIVNGAKGVIAREFDPLKVLDYIESGAYRTETFQGWRQRREIEAAAGAP